MFLTYQSAYGVVSTQFIGAHISIKTLSTISSGGAHQRHAGFVAMKHLPTENQGARLLLGWITHLKSTSTVRAIFSFFSNSARFFSFDIHLAVDSSKRCCERFVIRWTAVENCSMTDFYRRRWYVHTFCKGNSVPPSQESFYLAKRSRLSSEIEREIQQFWDCSLELSKKVCEFPPLLNHCQDMVWI